MRPLEVSICTTERNRKDRKHKGKCLAHMTTESSQSGKWVTVLYQCDITILTDICDFHPIPHKSFKLLWSFTFLFALHCTTRTYWASIGWDRLLSWLSPKMPWLDWLTYLSPSDNKFHHLELVNCRALRLRDISPTTPWTNTHKHGPLWCCAGARPFMVVNFCHVLSGCSVMKCVITILYMYIYLCVWVKCQFLFYKCLAFRANFE